MDDKSNRGFGSEHVDKEEDGIGGLLLGEGFSASSGSASVIRTNWSWQLWPQVGPRAPWGTL